MDLRRDPSARLRLPLPLLLLLLGTGPATAQDAWTVLPPVNRGFSEAQAAAIRDQLEAALSQRSGARFVAGAACADEACARQIGESVGAAVVILPRLARLGRAWVLTVNIIESPGGARLGRHRTQGSDDDPLDGAIARIAEAIVTGGSLEDLPTPADVAPPTDTSGLGLRLGGAVPLTGALGAGLGAGIEISYGFTREALAIEGRLGYRFSARDGTDRWSQLIADLGAAWILRPGHLSPYLGVGAGLRNTVDERREISTAGTLIRVTRESQVEDQALGLGLYARAGLMLLRTPNLQIALELEYDLTLSDIHGEQPQAVTFGLRVGL